jgi:anti-sigma regulatory factor (Ser/Thr protein kinase)
MDAAPPPDPTADLPLTVSAPAQAREWIQHATPIPEDIRDGVLLCLSELVANAVRHSGKADEGDVTIVVLPSDGRLHVEVQDPGEGRIRVTTDEDAHYGLRLVDSIADDWGFRTNPTTVWFEMRLPRARIT